MDRLHVCPSLMCSTARVSRVEALAALVRADKASLRCEPRGLERESS